MKFYAPRTFSGHSYCLVILQAEIIQYSSPAVQEISQAPPTLSLPEGGRAANDIVPEEMRSGKQFPDSHFTQAKAYFSYISISSPEYHIQSLSSFAILSRPVVR